MSQQEKNVGRVYLVGAGPGDPGLLTLRGRDCLARADLVLYDYLTNPAMLCHAPASAELLCLGHIHRGRSVPQAEVNRLMIEAAQAGKTVVRLKSGDPNLFGRGAEETAALTEAGIPFEVVPGVTSALAAASHAGVPITHREFASAVALVTGHQREDKTVPEFDYQALGAFPGTVVFYMGMTTAEIWSQAMIRGGKPADTPVLILRRVSWPEQKAYRTTLGEVAQFVAAEKLRPPALVIVGEAAGAAPETTWFTAKPLFGLRVLLTPGVEPIGPALAESGVEVLRLDGRIAELREWIEAGRIDAVVVPQNADTTAIAAQLGVRCEVVRWVECPSASSGASAAEPVIASLRELRRIAGGDLA